MQVHSICERTGNMKSNVSKDIQYLKALVFFSSRVNMENIILAYRCLCHQSARFTFPRQVTYSSTNKRLETQEGGRMHFLYCDHQGICWYWWRIINFD